MFCEKCGSALPDNVKYCDVCGARQSKAKRKKQEVTKNLIALGTGISLVALILAFVIPNALTAIRTSQDEKNLKLYKEYSENLEATNEAALDKLLMKYGGGVMNETAKKTEATENKKNTEKAKPTATPMPEEPKPTTVITPEPTQTPKATSGESSYIYVVKDCTWAQAQSECAARGGHLVHFDTPGEAEKVIGQLNARGYGEKSKFWIGGSRSGSQIYYWVNADGSYNGEVSLLDSHWLSGEPSYKDSGLDDLTEDKMMLIFYKNKWVYNDINGQVLQHFPVYSGNVGYICEIEG